MTQAQIDQLLAFASAEIDRHMGALTIQGGGGVYVDGYAADQTVSVQLPQPREDTRTPLGRMDLHIRIVGTQDINVEGYQSHTDIDSKYVLKRLSENSRAWHADWENAWVINAASDRGTHKRNIAVEFELKPYRFAMSVVIGYIDFMHNTALLKEIDLDRPGVIRYQAEIPAADTTFYVWFPRITRRGSDGPIASLINPDIPPEGVA